MKNLAIAVPLLFLADVTTAPQPPTVKEKILSGPEIIAVFEGKTVAGAYGDGLAVKETYAVGGGISYWDPRGNDTGQWSVMNNLFCTFYSSMAGGCFRIVQVSDNCFDYYALTATAEEALNPKDRPSYTARASIQGVASTCPDELQA